MSSLYEINLELLELAEIEEELDEQTLRDTWEALALERAEKIENVLSFIKHLRHMATGCKAEAKSLADRAKGYETKADNMLSYLQSQLKEREKYESTRHKITWRKSQSVEIEIDPALLPVPYQRIKTTVEPNKKALLDDLKAGGEIEGVKMIEKLNMGVK